MIAYHYQNDHYLIYVTNFFTSRANSLQLVMSGLFVSGQIRHGHHVHHHTGPAGKVLCPLAITRIRVVLFPSEPSLLPLAEDILD